MLGYVEMPSQEKTTKMIHEHAFLPLYLVLPFWILWIFHKQRYKQSQVHPQPHIPLTWSPPLDLCFRTSWGLYRTCPKTRGSQKKTSSKGLPGAPWVEKGWQQCRGEIPTCLILERRWHTCHRYIYCIPTRSSYTLWHSRIAHNSIRKTSDGVSFLQNIFNDSQILKYQGRHLIFTQETFIFGCVLKSGMPQWWYMMTNHGIWGF